MTDAIHIKDILQRDVEMFASMGHVDYLKKFILDHGAAYRGTKFKGKKMPKKECFCNALHYAQEHGLLYVEGYGISHGMASKGLPLAFEHAWCIDKKGKVVDPTWDDGPDASYMGIAFTAKEAVARVLVTGHYGLFNNGVCYDTTFIEQVRRRLQK